MWLDDIEFEIIKRIKYGLSLENLANNGNQLSEILFRLRNNEIISFNTHDDIDNGEIAITTKGFRLYAEKEYRPQSS